MNPNWLEFLEISGARIKNNSVADFGDIAGELTAARESTIISPLCHLALFGCSGEDARSFLHNQLTSDVNHLEIGSAQHSAWCSAKGRMQASFILYRQISGYRALVSADLQDASLKRLQIFILRSRVTLNDLSGNHELIGLAGPKASAALEGAGLPFPQKALEIAEFADGSVIRLDSSRFIIAIASGMAATCWQQLAGVTRCVGNPAWQWLDIQAGIPLITSATKEEFVPQMASFEKIGGVSFHKGCYPGQEVVARAQYLGKIKRHLYRIHTDGPVLPGTAIFLASDQTNSCGLVSNAAPAPGGGYDALAVIKESGLEGEEVRLFITGVEISNIVPVNL